jgi:hypothetical protein
MLELLSPARHRQRVAQPVCVVPVLGDGLGQLQRELPNRVPPIAADRKRTYAEHSLDDEKPDARRAPPAPRGRALDVGFLGQPATADRAQKQRLGGDVAARSDGVALGPRHGRRRDRWGETDGR